MHARNGIVIFGYISCHMKAFSILIALVLSSLVSDAQVPDLMNWKLDSLPVGERFYTANHSADNWLFKLTGGKWKVVQNKDGQQKGDSIPPGLITSDVKRKVGLERGQSFVKRVSDGFLVGKDGGEFGGGLFFIGLDGGLLVVRDRINVRSIIEYNGKLLAIEGLAHLGSYSGQILEIFKEGDRWSCRLLTTLVDAPILIERFGDELLIVTSQHLLKLGRGFKTTEVLKSPIYWGSLYPTSMLIDRTDLYLAMRQGVLKIKDFESQPVYAWYVL